MSAAALRRAHAVVPIAAVQTEYSSAGGEGSGLQSGAVGAGLAAVPGWAYHPRPSRARVPDHVHPHGWAPMGPYDCQLGASLSN